eukprot:2210204-Rhodomonas_salina.1
MSASTQDGQLVHGCCGTNLRAHSTPHGLTIQLTEYSCTQSAVVLTPACVVPGDGAHSTVRQRGAHYHPHQVLPG